MSLKHLKPVVTCNKNNRFCCLFVLKPDQLKIDNSIITDCHEIACKLNDFCTTVSLHLNSNGFIID